MIFNTTKKKEKRKKKNAFVKISIKYSHKKETNNTA